MEILIQWSSLYFFRPLASLPLSRILTQTRIKAIFSRFATASSLERDDSQNRTTTHPDSRSLRLTSRSRLRLRSIFFCQYSRLLFGRRYFWGLPCQKSPSTNTTTRCNRKTKSGRPSKLLARRHPLILCFLSKRINRSSVERFPALRIFAIMADRCCRENISAIAASS